MVYHISVINVNIELVCHTASVYDQYLIILFITLNQGVINIMIAF